MLLVFIQSGNGYVTVMLTYNIEFQLRHFWLWNILNVITKRSNSWYEVERGGRVGNKKKQTTRRQDCQKKTDCQSGSSIAAGWRCECAVFNLASILIYAGMTMRRRLWGAERWRTRPPLLCCASDALCSCSCEQRGEGGSEPGLISHSAPALQQLGVGDRHVHVCSHIVSASPIRLTARPRVRITFLFRPVTQLERAAAAAPVALPLRLSRCLHVVTRRDLAVNPIISHWPYFNGALNPH